MKEETPTNLIEGKFYRCPICNHGLGRVYKRRKANNPYPSCGHWADKQVEITEKEYKES